MRILSVRYPVPNPETLCGAQLAQSRKRCGGAETIGAAQTKTRSGSTAVTLPFDAFEVVPEE